MLNWKLVAPLGAALCMTCNFVAAQTVLVDESFDNYADQSAFEAVWQPRTGDGLDPATAGGFLIPTAETTALPAPINDPPGIQGKAVAGNFGGAINEWRDMPLSIETSATQSIVLKGDIFVGEDNEVSRQTIGLRNNTIDSDPNNFGFQNPLNLFEMGTWNAATCDPTAAGCNTGSDIIQDPLDPNYIESTQFGFRLAIFKFGSYGTLTHNGVEVGELLTAPNYQYFPLDESLDVTGGPDSTPDGLVGVADVGEGWHTFTATFTDTDLTLELDLFRNGINEVTGLSGVDSTVNIEVEMAEDPANPGVIAPFTSLRIGGPSAVTSQTSGGDPRPAAFDNILLQLVDPNAGNPDGDYDDNGMVDLQDYTIWRDALNSSVALPNDPTGGTIGEAQYLTWQANFGAGMGSLTSAPANVPEPTTVVLLGIAAAGLLAVRLRG